MFYRICTLQKLSSHRRQWGKITRTHSFFKSISPKEILDLTRHVDKLMFYGCHKNQCQGPWGFGQQRHHYLTLGKVTLACYFSQKIIPQVPGRKLLNLLLNWKSSWNFFSWFMTSWNVERIYCGTKYALVSSSFPVIIRWVSLEKSFKS